MSLIPYDRELLFFLKKGKNVMLFFSLRSHLKPVLIIPIVNIIIEYFFDLLNVLFKIYNCSSQGSIRPHCKGGCYRYPTRTQHHRTFRPGISILRKSRTSPVPRAPIPHRVNYLFRTKDIHKDEGAITSSSRDALTRTHATVGDDVANCY